MLQLRNYSKKMAFKDVEHFTGKQVNSQPLKKYYEKYEFTDFTTKKKVLFLWLPIRNYNLSVDNSEFVYFIYLLS